MNCWTSEWIAKAEGDWLVSQRELAVLTNPIYDAVCFHAQQCAEKYLKARLAEAEREIPRIHDLNILLERLADLGPDWTVLAADANLLTSAAVEVRYPGHQATYQEAEQAVAAASRVRQAVRAALGLDA
ncbi:MAG: HEPN domain-containing protein [Armatimonadetes bacterium]|nr:HEPN domain-containing protein [Armatimonadota bacterium]